MRVLNQPDDSEQMGSQEPPEYPSESAGIRVCQLEEELNRVKAELEQYRALYENLPLPYFTLDPSGKILAINPLGAAHLRYVATELVGQPIFAFFCPKDVPTLRSAITEALQNPQEAVRFQAGQLCRDGQTVWVKATVKAVENAQHGTIALLSCEEITATKPLETEYQPVEAEICPAPESDQHWHLVENAPDQIFTCDRNGKLRSFNHPITDLTVEQMVETSIYDYIPPAHHLKLKLALRQVFQTGATVRCESASVGMHGAITWYSSQVGPIWRVGQVVEAVVVCTDITERKQAEEALRANEYRYAQILDSVQDMIFCKASSSAIVYANKAACNYFGMTTEELQKTTELAQSQPDFKSPYVEADLQVFTTRQAVEILEEPCTRSDGTIRFFHTIKSPIFDAEGNIVELVAACRDITEQKQAQSALQENEERFRQLTENIQEVFWMVSLADGHRLIYVSPAYETIWQRSCESLYQQPQDWMNVIHSEDRDRVFLALETMAEGGYDIEYRIVRPDSSICWIRDRAFPIQAPDGNVYRVAGIAEDITERKRTENALRQQAKREQLLGAIAQRIRQSLDLDEILNTTVTEVRQLLHADRTIVFRFQPDWNGVVVVESVAPPWSAILGTTSHDPCYAKAYTEQYRQGRIQTVENIFTAGLGKTHQELLTQFQIKANLVVPILQGEYLWGLLLTHQYSESRQWQSHEVDLLKELATQLEIAIHQSQLFQQIQSLNADLEHQVQERTTKLRKTLDCEALLKRITDKVRDSLEESQILQTAVQELVIELQTYSCDTGLYDLNQVHSTICYEYVCADTGIPPGAGITVPFSVYPEVYCQLLQGQYFQFCWLPTFDDPARLTDCPFTILACPIMDDQKVIGDLWLYRAKEDLFEDVEIRLIQQVANHCAIALRQSRLYQSAQAQVEELERLNHLKDDFLSTVSHELRTPVANIRMATQMLEINLDRLGILGSQTNSVTRYVQVLKEECQREISLINDLLDLTRIESETEPLRLAEIDLCTWLSYIAEPFLERTESQHQQLIIDVSTEPLVFITDISYLERILRELLQNACKYTPVDETIQISTQAKATHIEICVSNTGIEIPADELERVFDKFYRIPNNDPWKHGGTGLGLALVKRLVTRLDGTISVCSHPGRTTFTLQFPQVHPTWAHDRC